MPGDQRRLCAVFAPAVTANSTELAGELAAKPNCSGTFNAWRIMWGRTGGAVNEIWDIGSQVRRICAIIGSELVKIPGAVIAMRSTILCWQHSNAIHETNRPDKILRLAGIRVSGGEILISDSQPRHRCWLAAPRRDNYDRSPVCARWAQFC